MDVDAEVSQDDLCEIPGADLGRVRSGRRGLLSPSAYTQLAEGFRALADPSRVKIVHCLLGQELCTCDLAAIARLSEPAVSQHLKVLRDLRIVKKRRVGRMVFYSLDDAHVRLLLRVSLRHLVHSQDDVGVENGRTE